MPYNTQYRLMVHGAGESEDEGIFEMLDDLGALGYALQRSSGQEYITYEPCNWWNHDDVMLEISRKFPRVRFSLQGVGDNPDDIWESHYLGGKTYTQAAIITIPPFDPTLLRELQRGEAR